MRKRVKKIAYTKTNTDTHTLTHKHIYIQIQTHTYTNTHKNKSTHTNKITNINTLSLSHTHTLTHINSQSLVHRLVGDILVCCGFLSYSGPFNQDFRIVLNKNWMKELKSRKIPLSANLNPVEMLVDPTTVSAHPFIIFEL